MTPGGRRTQRIGVQGFLVCATTIFALFSGAVDVDAQGTFVYTNNDRGGANTVSAFSVGTNGTLTQIPGSPFATGGSGTGGGFFAANRVTVSVAGNFLFVSNAGSNNISVFSIDPSTGSLTLVPGAPFPTGGSGFSISLGVTPDSKFLYAGNSTTNNISAFSIAPNGALAPVPGSPFFAQGSPDGVKVSPDGKFLSVALPGTGPGSVAMFGIASNGTLTAVPGSPFPDQGIGVAAGVDINCDSSFVFAGEANSGQTIVDVFRIAGNGSLTPIAGSAFNFLSGGNSNVPVLSPDDRFLFVSNQDSNTITVLNVASNGSLTLVAGSPFVNPGGAVPSGMATNRAGTFLYIANLNATVTAFTVAGNGTLTPVPGSPFPTGQPGGLLSLTVYPAKNCGAAAGPPTSLTLDPPTAVNVAGEPHCVTATVLDTEGNPVPGITVRFAVSGANSASGSATTDANGKASFCYTGTNAGNDTISAFADTDNDGTQDGGEPSDTAQKMYVAAAPATLTLDPLAATNPVDSQHCVTATVRDAFGNPTPGIVVRFTVTGSVNTAGSVNTGPNGEATFCYMGPPLPGADVIRAFADTDNDGTRDLNEPNGVATKTWILPVTTPLCEITITNGGRIVAANGDRATFGGNAKSSETGDTQGEEEYQDHGPAQALNVHSINVLAIVCDGSMQASIYGQATVDGAGSFFYRIRVTDLAEPGSGQDMYEILLANGYYSGEKVLEGGNVQIQRR